MSKKDAHLANHRDRAQIVLQIDDSDETTCYQKQNTIKFALESTVLLSRTDNESKTLDAIYIFIMTTFKSSITMKNVVHY
jgi:hypothetical protein